MASKVIEIVKINDSDGSDDDDADKISLIYETKSISNIKGITQENPIILEDDEDEDEGVIINTKRLLKGECSNSKSGDEYVIIKEESSNYPPVFICEICSDAKPVHGKFQINGCDHRYCCDCISKYVASKIQDNIIHVTCPSTGCSGELNPQCCREILPPQVFDRWGDALCEDMILASQRFYCPFKDCSALLIVDQLPSEEVIKQSECPYCWRMFCAQCKVPWHAGIECTDFQQLNANERERDDILLMKLANTNKWMRCPQCHFYVERTEGCLSMKCRCGSTFCYNCGALLLNDHYCSSCKR